MSITASISIPAFLGSALISITARANKRLWCRRAWSVSTDFVSKTSVVDDKK